ncbi:hypothetical protein HNQ80_005063 [Anaerosolibacter carboniphilus]|uniref:Uncharacterized protein n=1 Tax=Anaerosolibacter carboniphilus TaxID=1417629 RepID=A0A841L2N0_9FIRM|nr:hypothetical protein [Anaerosolibacter carboniphilus]MBB6218888.1 hypothetical protein [Anaerosolibacter carboniphilus]
MNKREEQLRTRFSQLKDEYLIEIIKGDYKDYEEDAIQLVKEELDSRGIDYTDTEVCETIAFNEQLRRFSFRDEKFKKKYINSAILFFIWILYIVMYSLKTHRFYLIEIEYEYLIEFALYMVLLIGYDILIYYHIREEDILLKNTTVLLFNVWLMYLLISFVHGRSLMAIAYLLWPLIPVLSVIITNQYLEKDNRGKLPLSKSLWSSFMHEMRMSILAYIALYVSFVIR